jgi:hypothetical protein
MDAVEADARYDGKYVLRTNRFLSPGDAAQAYKSLWQVERAFRELKSGLDLRPVYHWTEKRIRGHVMVCFLALVLETALRRKLTATQCGGPLRRPPPAPDRTEGGRDTPRRPYLSDPHRTHRTRSPGLQGPGHPATGSRHRDATALDRPPAGRLARLGARKLIQELLEAEVSETLGRDRYERGGKARGHRNGYKLRRLLTAEGALPVRLPQVRDTEEPFRSELWQGMRKRTDVLENLVLEMYVRGLSTRGIEDALREVGGDQPLLSRSSVSRLSETLWEEYEAFAQRDLGGYDVVHLFADAIYESLREQAGFKEGILASVGHPRGRGQGLDPPQSGQQGELRGLARAP